MKVYIGIEVEPMNGYTTIDPSGGEGKIGHDIRNLDSVCETAQCREIRAPNILNYIHTSELVGVMKNWVSKLRHGGKIIVGGSDLFECCKSVFLGHISIEEANNLFYNSKSNPWSVNFGMYETGELVNILSALGLRIEKRRVNGHNFVVEAYRD